MAYNWNWNEKSGTFTFDGYTYNFYKGNGFMIVLDEFVMTEKRMSVDDTAEDIGKECYRVVWFFVDKQHAKRCLGLEKGSYDMFEGNVEKITQPNIVIEILPTERKEVAE